MPVPKAPRPTVSEFGEDFDFPFPEDRDAVQRGIGEVLRRVASGVLDARRAGILLYGLSLASNNLPRAVAAQPVIPDAPITEVVIDQQLGIIALSQEDTLEPTQTRTTPALYRKGLDDAFNKGQDEEFDFITRDSAQRTAARAAARTPVIVPPSCFATPEQLRAMVSRR